MNHSRKNRRIVLTRPFVAGCLISVFLAGSMPPALAGIPAVEIAQEPLLHGGAAMPAVALAGGRMTTEGNALYQAGFVAARWSGSLKKYSLVSGVSSVQIAAVPDWDAGEILSGHGAIPPRPQPGNRKIYTADAATASGLVEFEWSKLASSQRALLDASPLDGKPDGLGARRLDFLRGMRNDEIGQPHGLFRARDGVLGDIINSNLVHVGAPAADRGDAGYRLFYDTRNGRTKAVYAGANDGMLHAFDAGDGTELFAYVPCALLEWLPQLSRSDYRHRPYADGAIAVADARVQGSWKTVLAAGMGGGAQGLFVLDVSDPADFANGSGALWEFTDRDDADMGNVSNQPVIARFRTGVVSGIPVYRYFVAVGSGLNNYRNDGHANPHAPAVLFLLSLDKKAADPWRLGVNYFKFRKPVLDLSLPNGLGAPAMAIGADGAVRYAYAGDLQGNLWRFDFSGNLPWAKENTGSIPLFTAQDAKGRRQPVTTQPRVVFAPGGGYVVLFGTGKFVEEADTDPAGFAIQSFYGIYDSLHKTFAVSGRRQLELRTLSKAGEALQIDGAEFNYGDGADQKRGWYFDFLASDRTGERSVSNPLLESGLLLFNSLIPCVAPCADGGGRSYVLDALSGLPVMTNSTGKPSQIGMLAGPALLEAAVASGKRNAFGKAITVRKSIAINAGSGGLKGSLAAGNDDADGGMVEVSRPAMRFSWREVLNWQELRLDANNK